VLASADAASARAIRPLSGRLANNVFNFDVSTAISRVGAPDGPLDVHYRTLGLPPG
jgi:hypothetical protein